MRSWYEIQQRLLRLHIHLGLTRAESRGLLLLAFLVVLGGAVRAWHLQIPRVEPAAYAALEAEFRARAARIPAPELVGPPAPDSLGIHAGASGDAPAVGGEAAGLIDLNTADSKTLQTLPRIGPQLAARILRHREHYGPFLTVEDLLMVSGIGPATLARLRSLVVVTQDSGVVAGNGG